MSTESQSSTTTLPPLSDVVCGGKNGNGKGAVHPIHVFEGNGQGSPYRRRKRQHSIEELKDHAGIVND